MSRGRVLATVIETCFDCSWLCRQQSGNDPWDYYCFKFTPWRLVTQVEHKYYRPYIPEWCPLPLAEVKECINA